MRPVVFAFDPDPDSDADLSKKLPILARAVSETFSGIRPRPLVLLFTHKSFWT
jgi:hypothetical protein